MLASQRPTRLDYFVRFLLTPSGKVGILGLGFVGLIGFEGFTGFIAYGRFIRFMGLREFRIWGILRA